MISLSALTFMRLVLFYSDTQVRLTGHNSSYAGRVEVFAHGAWGRVLSYYWDQTEAAVVCRQLGFPGVITALRHSSFGEGSGPVLMSNVQCIGSEKTIQQCQYDDWFDSDVVDGRQVGVVCKSHDFDPDVREIPIRLQGSSVPNAGRVEVLYAGIWGAISENNWDINDARVACRQLGYQTGAEAALKNGVYGPVSGPVWLTNLQCSGSETNVMSCSHDVIGNKSELQRPQYVASVICKDGSLSSEMPVRLRGSSSPNMGRVEVYYAGKWGSIYYNNFDINDATVVCRQLGYSTASLSGYGLFCSATIPHWFTNFRCYGNESSLDQCARDFLTYFSSSYYYCANVFCKYSMADTGLEIRLSGSPVPHAGRVELRIKGIWGTIGCRHRLLPYGRPIDKLARVLCRQLNFTDSILAAAWSLYGEGTGPQFFFSYDIQCLGNERNLLNCSHRDPYLARRRHYSDLSVVCKPNAPQTSDFTVRLNGTSLPFAGTIEVMYQGVWGGVQGSSFVDIYVGHVVCRQLGFSGANRIFYRETFGKWKGPLLIWRMQCSGNEAKISDCAVTTWDNVTDRFRYSAAHNQKPNRAAGVLCNAANSSASYDLKVRVSGAPVSNAGRVEVFYAGVWGAIVDYNRWNINGAHVVCRQLGYPGAISSGNSNQFGLGAGPVPVWFRRVKCLGNETNIGECSKDFYGYLVTGYEILATVLCKLQYQSDNSLNCTQVKCANNGTCIKTGGGAACNCTEGFTGLHCEIPTFNPCQSSPCDNGGKCFSNGSSSLCTCPKGLTGKRCEEPIATANNPCQSRPCSNNTSCHHNETHFSCVSNDIQTTAIDVNEIRLKNSGNSSTTAAEQDIFNTPFIVLLSVFAAVIVLLIAAVVYLIFRDRRRTKHPPRSTGAVFSNMAFNGGPENNLDEEEAKKSFDVDLGIGTNQTKKMQDPGAIYDEASRPLPPIPVPHNTTRKEAAGKKDLRAASNKANIAPVSVPRASEEHYIGLTKEHAYGNNAAPSVPPRAGAGTYSNNYMSLSPAGRLGNASYSSPNSSSLQTSGANQHRKNGKRRKESHEMYENTGK